MNGMRIAFVTGALTGILGCTAANIIAQERTVAPEADGTVVIPPGSPPNALLIMATRGGRIAIRDEWGAPVDPSEPAPGDWERVVEIVIERLRDDPDVGLQHTDGTRHNHCRARAADRYYEWIC